MPDSLQPVFSQVVKPALQVVIPIYNPHGDWAAEMLQRFEDLQGAFPQLLIRLTLVEDGSSQPASQKDIALLQDSISGFQYFAYAENKGKGYALRYGFSRTNAALYLYTDIDFPYTLESMQKLITALQSGADVAIGIRDEEYYEEVPLGRRLLSKAARFMMRGLLRIPVTDTQGGLKGFSELGKGIFLDTKIHRFLFDMEFVQKAYRQKDLCVEAIPVEARKGLTFTKFRIGLVVKELFNFVRLIRPFSR